MSSYGMFTSVGFTQEPAEIEVRVDQHGPSLRISIDNLSFLLEPATARKLRDALNALDLGES